MAGAKAAKPSIKPTPVTPKPVVPEVVVQAKPVPPTTVSTTATISGETAGAGQAATSIDAMAGVRAAGQAGEDMAGIVKNTQRIPSASGTAAYRIPDELGNGILGEVKNTSSLSMTNQLRDFLAYAQDNGLQFNLYVREKTNFSGPLKDLIDAGVINRVPRLGP